MTHARRVQPDFPRGYYSEDFQMSRTAIDRIENSHFGGSSRIPRPFGQSQQAVMQNGQPGSGRKPSRLQQLQSDYQQRLLKEKEDKMIQMYEDTQSKALSRVNNQNKGMVRNFFHERRNLPPDMGNSQNPTMDHMYKQKKHDQVKTGNNFGYKGQNNGYRQSPPGYGVQKKTSAGRDRANPLAPIQRNSPNQNPFPSKPQIVRPRTMKETTPKQMEYQNNGPVPKSAPSHNYPPAEFSNEDDDDDSPPPNLQQLKFLQQKRLQSQRSNRSGGTASTQSRPTRIQEPMTDFQRWQQEQNQDREERLRKHPTNNQPPPDEGYDDEEGDENVASVEQEMARKQQELRAQIEAQQAELERIRKEREREELQEAKEVERRRKFEEDRKGRQREEEEQRRREEEDERMKTQWEEEKLRKIQDEKRRMRKVSDRFDSDEDMSSNRPTPPTGPKPQNSRRKAPPSQPPPPKKVPPPASKQTPFKSGEHTQIYEQATRDSDAYETKSVNLVACYNCGRKFADDRVDKHQQFCKNLTKKRKVMDPTKLRTAGTELEQYVNRRAPSPKEKAASNKVKKGNWRAKHESFINSIRYAKKVTQMESEGVSLANLPPPPRSENPDYVQCPYCSRRFNPNTADRHIPHCKNTKSRPAPPPKGRR